MGKESKVFASLLKYWRGKRGLSQLDLALRADVSTRHISFLETGRSQPSEEMVLRLVEALDLPLRERNVVLQEAGYEAQFPEPELSALDQPGTRTVIDLMMAQQEPYPLIVMNRWYDIVAMNNGGKRLVSVCLGDSVSNQPINAMAALFKSELLKPVVLDWEIVAKEMLARLHREQLHRPQDQRLAGLLSEVLAMPGIPEDWRTPDLSRGTAAVLPFRLLVNGSKLEFVTTITEFSTPQNVTLQELQIESYFPLNEQTAETWSRLSAMS